MDNKANAGRREVKEETEMQHFGAAEMNSCFVRDKAEWPNDPGMKIRPWNLSLTLSPSSDVNLS